MDGRRAELDLLGVVTTVHVAWAAMPAMTPPCAPPWARRAPPAWAWGHIPPIPIPKASVAAPCRWRPTTSTSSLRAQIGACAAMARICGVPMISVKAHGSLYAEVGRGDPACAALLRALDGLCEPGTAVVLPAGAPALGAVRRAGYAALEEGFCDRAYGSDGGLVDRGVPGAVYDDPARAAHQALALAERVDTLCVHGDSPGALAMAVAVRAALTQAGVTVAAPSRP